MADSIKCIFQKLGLISFIILTGCVNEDVSDLTRYIKNIKSKPPGVIQPLPEIKVVEPFIFNPENLRDPFQPEVRIEGDIEEEITVGTGSIRPDTSRRKEELEAYSLDSLRMVGTVNIENEKWGLVKGVEGTIHRVKKGNHMGRNYGEIIRILDDKIELMEIVSDKPGVWREQQASMVLAE